MTQNNKQINSPDEASNDTQQETVEFDETLHPTEEFGGPKGLEPTRYGDWERKGRCIDF